MVVITRDVLFLKNVAKMMDSYYFDFLLFFFSNNMVKGKKLKYFKIKWFFFK